MSRPLYLEVSGGTFHVVSRGNARRTIFHNDQDRQAFLAELRYVLRRRGWRCLAYCLMSNHFHLVVNTPRGNLAEGMRDLKSGYATGYNARRGVDGSLFKKGYRPQLVQDETYLLTVVAYVVLNPVRAGIVSDPGHWPWSSFTATMKGERDLVEPERVLQLLHPDPDQARRRFRNLARELAGVPAYDPSLPILGDKAFIEEHAPEQRPGREVAKAAWNQSRPALDELVVSLDELDFIREARLTYRYTLKEIAARLGCSERTVQRRL